jgi:hypothetical protein
MPATGRDTEPIWFDKTEPDLMLTSPVNYFLDLGTGFTPLNKNFTDTPRALGKGLSNRINPPNYILSRISPRFGIS